MENENFSELKNNGQSAGEVSVLESNEHGQAKDIMQCGVVTVKKNRSIYDAIEIMVKKDLSGLPVVDGEGFIGVISEKDVLGLLYEATFLPHSVEEYMTRDVVSFNEKDDLSVICECLKNNVFRRVPILRNGKLAGIISRADFIKAKKDKFKPQVSAEKSTKHKDNLPAKEAMTCGLFTIGTQTSIYEAIEILTTRNITGLPVVDDCMHFVGIVTEKDLLNLLYNHSPRNVRAEDIMTEEVISFNQDDSLFDVCQCLMNNHFRRIPVLNQGKLTGIISRRDIIIYILKNKSSFFQHKHMVLSEKQS